MNNELTREQIAAEIEACQPCTTHEKALYMALRTHDAEQRAERAEAEAAMLKEAFQVIGTECIRLSEQSAPPASEPEKCPECHGTGECCMGGESAHPRNWYACEQCGGSGKATDPAPADRYGYMTGGVKAGPYDRGATFHPMPAPADRPDDRVCAVCDGGPGNNCQCSCGEKKWDRPEPSEALRPCPFCGSVEGDRVAVFPDADGWAAGCSDGCRLVFRRAAKTDAIAAWNHRDLSQTVPPVPDAVRRLPERMERYIADFDPTSDAGWHLTWWKDELERALAQPGPADTTSSEALARIDESTDYRAWKNDPRGWIGDLRVEALVNAVEGYRQALAQPVPPVPDPSEAEAELRRLVEWAMIYAPNDPNHHEGIRHSERIVRRDLSQPVPAVPDPSEAMEVFERLVKDVYYREWHLHGLDSSGQGHCSDEDKDAIRRALAQPAVPEGEATKMHRRAQKAEGVVRQIENARRDFYGRADAPTDMRHAVFSREVRRILEREGLAAAPTEPAANPTLDPLARVAEVCEDAELIHYHGA